MLYKVFNAATVTPRNIFLGCEETKVLGTQDDLYLPLDEDGLPVEVVLPHFKVRHSNRLKVSVSDRTKRLIEDNVEIKRHRNRREYNHRSKEKRLLRAA